jgi:HlyD family secretion protein
MRAAFDRPSNMDLPRPPSKKRRRLIIGAVIGLGALVAVTLGLKQLRQAAPIVDRAAVLVGSVERGPMLRAVQGAGSLVPEDIRWLSATSGGRIERIRVRPGVQVTADTILVDIANPDVELAALEAERQVAGAAAELANLRAKSDNERLGQQAVVAGTRSDLDEATRRADADGALAKRGYLSDLEMARSRDQAKTLDGKLDIERQRLLAQARGIHAQIDAQDAQLGRLRAIADFRRRSVEQLHVRAGVDGVLQELPLQVGQSVAPGALVAKVADPTRLKAEVRIPETQAKEVRVGQPAVIDTRNGTVAGRVSRVEPAVTLGTVKVEVTPTAPWPDGARPDLTIEGTIELERIADTLFVGRPAVAEPGATVQLWKLVGDDGAVRIPVTLGRMSVRTIEVQKGLAAGDRVIISDMSQWDNQTRVQLR